MRPPTKRRRPPCRRSETIRFILALTLLALFTVVVVALVVAPNAALRELLRTLIPLLGLVLGFYFPRAGRR